MSMVTGICHVLASHPALGIQSFVMSGTHSTGRTHEALYPRGVTVLSEPLLDTWALRQGCHVRRFS